MWRSIRLLVLMVFVLTGLWGTRPLAESAGEIDGEQVYDITRAFLGNHYSREGLDDEHARIMFDNYVEQLDPAHLYFLQSDMEAFRQYRERLDDLIREENIRVAFDIFERFQERLEQRYRQIAGILAKPLDLQTDERPLGDREAAPYPQDDAEARGLWKRKLKFELMELMAGGESAPEAREVLDRRYRNIKLRYERYNHNDVVSDYLNAFTAAYDPHSGYLSPEDLENFNIALRLSLEGIGATLRSEDGYTVVTSIIPGGAADRAGTLEPEDKIVAVGQGAEGRMVDVVNERLSDVVKMIRGPRGTKVRLSLLRKAPGAVDTKKVITLVRDKIELTEGEASGEIIERADNRTGRTHAVGVITLPSFYVDFAERRVNPLDYKSSSRDVKRILERFSDQGVEGIVLDLRNNGGGGLDEAVSLSGMFLDEGPVVRVKDFRGRLSTLDNPHDEPSYEGPLLVLTNRYSASASEILAGALKDYGRAILVGDRSTFGKGTVQNIINLSEGLGAVKATVAKFYRPGSASTQHRGVRPDIVLPSVHNHMEIGESSLENALPWDAIQRADFERWGDLSPYLPILQERSRQRRRDDETFRAVAQAVKTYRENNDRQESLTARAMWEDIRKNGDQPAAVVEGQVLEGGELPENARNDAQEEADQDIYLDESISILLDYIRLRDDRGPATDVAGQYTN